MASVLPAALLSCGFIFLCAALAELARDLEDPFVFHANPEVATGATPLSVLQFKLNERLLAVSTTYRPHGNADVSDEAEAVAAAAAAVSARAVSARAASARAAFAPDHDHESRFPSPFPLSFPPATVPHSAGQDHSGAYAASGGGSPQRSSRPGSGVPAHAHAPLSLIHI